MGLGSWIIFGLIAGLFAKWIMPGKAKPQGCIVTVLLGILGAVVGGFIGTQLGIGDVSDFTLKSLGLAVIGSLILLFIYAAFKRH